MKWKAVFLVALWAGMTWSVRTEALAAQLEAVEVTPEYITRLSEELLANNPALGAAAARTNAATAAVGAVRTWEDPMVRAGGMIASEMMRKEDGDILYGVEQKLPLWGKPRLARNATQAASQVESANYDYTFQSRRSELAKQLYETAAAERIVDLSAEDVGWLEAIAQTLEARYRSGQATMVEVMQAQNEKARRADQVKVATERVRQARFMLNRFLNRPPEFPWPPLLLPTPAQPITYSQKLTEMAFKYEPRMRLMRQQIAQAQAGVESARRERYPDVSLEFEGRNYSGNGDFRQGMAGISINVPWFNSGKYRQQVRRELAMKEMTEKELEDYQLELRAEVHGLTLKIEAARREAVLYRDEIIPRSETALASARSAWESGGGMFRDLLEARRMLLEARTMRIRATAEQYINLSELVLCCGLGDLEALTMLEPMLRGQTNAAPAAQPNP
jgi:outer membrane protein TolC